VKSYTKLEKIELKTYELLGIKHFRKLVFKILEIFIYKKLKNMTKSERKKYMMNKRSNYNIGRDRSYERIKKFKNKLYSNALIHTYGIIIIKPNIIKIINGNIDLISEIISILFLIINIYCIMLQRYNCIRINKTLRNMLPKYEKKKQELKQDYLKEYSILKNYKLTIVDYMTKKEKQTTIEELIETASLKELKEYKKALENFQNHLNNNFWLNEINENHEEIVDEIGEYKLLKLRK